jgi:hypothetical protein
VEIASEEEAAVQRMEVLEEVTREAEVAAVGAEAGAAAALEAGDEAEADALLRQAAAFRRRGDAQQEVVVAARLAAEEAGRTAARKKAAAKEAAAAGMSAAEVAAAEAELERGTSLPQSGAAAEAHGAIVGLVEEPAALRATDELRALKAVEEEGALDPWLLLPSLEEASAGPDDQDTPTLASVCDCGTLETHGFRCVCGRPELSAGEDGCCGLGLGGCNGYCMAALADKPADASDVGAGGAASEVAMLRRLALKLFSRAKAAEAKVADDEDTCPAPELRPLGAPVPVPAGSWPVPELPPALLGNPDGPPRSLLNSAVRCGD